MQRLLNFLEDEGRGADLLAFFNSKLLLLHLSANRVAASSDLRHFILVLLFASFFARLGVWSAKAVLLVAFQRALDSLDPHLFEALVEGAGLLAGWLLELLFCTEIFASVFFLLLVGSGSSDECEDQHEEHHHDLHFLW